MVAYLDRFCDDLPTEPAFGKKILVTGATGYIGGELIPALVERGYRIRVLVRSFLPEYEDRWPTVEIVAADVLDYSQLTKAIEGIDCAYYLIHSLHLAIDFRETDTRAAENFQRAAEENNLKRIIYLGSLGNPEANLSGHLRSRLKVASDLKKGKTPVTFLRAAVIIGSGSTSYKIINSLIRRCPIFIFPAWAGSVCQPIAIQDVIKYLVGCLETEETSGKTFDIGGEEILTYRTMLKIQAKVLKKKRIFINSQFSSLNFYSKIAAAVTPVSADLVKVLMDSCKNDVVCDNMNITTLIPFQSVNYTEALERALTRESQKKMIEKKKTVVSPLSDEGTHLTVLKPPPKSWGILSDFRYFIFNKPNKRTQIDFNSPSQREDYSYRILQRLGIEVSSYNILNVHKIGVDVPAKYVFEELLKWNGESSCWPNYIAKVVDRHKKLKNLSIYLFGWTKFPQWIRKSLVGRSFIPLFRLNAIDIKKYPDSDEFDNARYMLYNSVGGYPIGFFALYVRSSIPDEQEIELSQLFLIVGFNFYGNKNWTKRNLISRIWESLHDRVTSNVLCKVKQLSEWRFEKLKMGD